MPYWRLFYHIVCATEKREPLLQGAFVLPLYKCISGKATQLGGIVHALGGVEDHVHLAVSVPPSMALSEFIRQVKGVSSHFANHELQMPGSFSWQAEYGVMSLGSKQLGSVVQYVKEQRQHHAQQTTIPALERLGEDEA